MALPLKRTARWTRRSHSGSTVRGRTTHRRGRMGVVCNRVGRDGGHPVDWRSRLDWLDTGRRTLTRLDFQYSELRKRSGLDQPVSLLAIRDPGRVSNDRCRFPVPARRSTTRYPVMVWHVWQFETTQLPSSQVFSLGTGDQRNQRSPPLASRCSPVSQWESSDARKTATGAISVTCPIRPNGVWATNAFSKSEPINPPV